MNERGGPARGRSEGLHVVVATCGLGYDRGSPLRIRRRLRLLDELGRPAAVFAYPSPGSPNRVHTGRLPLSAPRRPGFSRRKLVLDLDLALRVAVFAARRRPEIIEGHVHEGLAIALLARLVSPGTRVVFDAHGALADEMAATGHVASGGFLHRVLERVEGWLERRADAVIAQSEHRADTIAGHGVPPARITVCPDGPEAAVLEILPDSRPRSVTCLYTGSLNTYQGLDDILQAARGTPGVQYVIFGSPSGGYPRLAHELGVADRVAFIDPAPLSELNHHLAHADIALAPRRYGGNIPGKLPIYQAAGLPVVGTDVPGITELVGAATGSLVPPGAPAALAAAINELAGQPQRRRELGRAARAQAQRLYSPEAVQGSLERAYRCATA